MKHRNTRCWTRRDFLKGAAWAVAAPHIIPAGALGLDGRPAPSERVVLGYIGLGPRGLWNAREQMNCPQAQLVAVCDVWKNRREQAKAIVDAHYKNKDCAAYVDFRELLARPDIDAVGIATTDHWHVPMTIAAARAGKDAHTEKPLGISIAEDSACREAVKRYGRVFQYGAESRSTAVSRLGAELIRSGRLGRIREIRVKAPNSVRGGSREPRPVPEGLDYEMWLGPAPWRPYSGCPDSGPDWFHVRDYALGFIAGWAAHPLDLMVWAYDTHTTGPLEVEGTGVIPTEGCNDVVMDWNVRIRFGDGVVMTFQAWGVEPETEPKLAEAGNYAQFIGEEGWIALSYRRLVTEPDSLARTPIGAYDVHLPQSAGHEANFIECVRSRRTPVDPIDDAVRSDLISHVSEIAIRTGRKIKWDPVKEEIIGDPEAARLVARGARDPWKV
ncbi:MAG: Gfo/Idh/MocA family oxidoreductase [Verrucomicrobiae bacterium]|nr:Gfo/Idh/MocA family oxidoreductase [Verrucomicrobiae bacterium]